MSVVIKKNEILDEKIIIKTLSTGAKCYIIPKCGYCEKQAMIAVKYGSNDINFQKGINKISSPLGVAHFLEHKLFEEEWGDAFQEFSKNGADANAFTDCNKTAYYFSCKDKFFENFKLLLEFVQSPYFTEESCEREKGIISQEIRMYDDDPNWKVYFNMLNGMYKNHPIKHNIAGSVESIKDITANTLKECYDGFYTSDNIAIVCVGDLDIEKICKDSEQLIKKKCTEKSKSTYEKEDENIVKTFVEEKMDISKPIFNIGYKQKPFGGKYSSKKIYGMKILMDLVAGEGSDFYNKMYNMGIVDEEFGLQFMNGQGFAFSIFAGSGKNPKKVGELLQKEIERIIKEGIDNESFLRLKKKHLGRFIRGFNSINAIAMTQIDLALKDLDLLSAFDDLNNVRKIDLEKMLKEDFLSERQVISVISCK